MAIRCSSCGATRIGFSPAWWCGLAGRVWPEVPGPPTTWALAKELAGESSALQDPDPGTGAAATSQRPPPAAMAWTHATTPTSDTGHAKFPMFGPTDLALDLDLAPIVPPHLSPSRPPPPRITAPSHRERRGQRPYIGPGIVRAHRSRGSVASRYHGRRQPRAAGQA